MMPRCKTRGSKLNSFRRPMLFVSRTSLFYRGAGAPNLGRKNVTSAQRDLTAATSGNFPACAPRYLTPEPVAATCSRLRGSSPRDLRGRQRGPQDHAGPRRPAVRSRVRARAQPLWRPNHHRCDARGSLQRSAHREEPRGVGSPYLAARKTPPGDVRPTAPKRLAQNNKRPSHCLLHPDEGLEWVEE